MLAKEEAFIARFKARASHAAQVQSRVKKLEKIEKVEAPKRRRSVQFDFKPAPRSGDDVVNVSGLKKAYGSRKIYDSFDLLIRRRERWCVMGINGAGKSTLLKLIAGSSQPDAGQISVGASVKVGYFAQHAMELLNPEHTVWDALITEFPQASIGALRTLAGVFGFSGDDVEKPCRILSGGEKARLVLAKMLFDPPNFLILDEPTNHLDMTTKEMLVEALKNFEGTMLFVSHDRNFLGMLSNRVLELTLEGRASTAAGTPSTWRRAGTRRPGCGAERRESACSRGDALSYNRCNRPSDIPSSTRRRTRSIRPPDIRARRSPPSRPRPRSPVACSSSGRPRFLRQCRPKRGKAAAGRDPRGKEGVRVGARGDHEGAENQGGESHPPVVIGHAISSSEQG